MTILYLDTSALVKLYVTEVGSKDVATWVARARHVGTSRVAYPEARAALARRQREGAFGVASLRRAVQALDADLPAYTVVELAPAVALRAGDLAERHGLRGFDAIHLASALVLGQLLGATAELGVFDARLAAAAAAEGLRPLP